MFVKLTTGSTAATKVTIHHYGGRVIQEVETDNDGYVSKDFVVGSHTLPSMAVAERFVNDLNARHEQNARKLGRRDTAGEGLI